MPQTFGTSLICYTHHIPMKRMNILGFYVPYCPICTKPKKKAKKPYPVPKMVQEANKIKKKINKEYWTKGAVKISAYKPKGLKQKEKLARENDGYHHAKDGYKFSRSIE